MFFLYTIACTVVEAPEDFDSLTSYLFQHVETEDERVLKAGAHNMISWLDIYNHELLEGYQVDDLTLEAIHSVSPHIEEVSLLGAAVSMNIRQENKIINQELSLLTEKEHFYVGGDTNGH